MVQSVADTPILTYIHITCICMGTCVCVCVFVCVCVCVCMYYVCMHARMQFGNIKWSSTVGINKNEKIYRFIIKNTE